MSAFQPYHPRPTLHRQHPNGNTIDVFTMCEPFQAFGLAAMLQPMFAVQLKLGIDNGVWPFDFDYDLSKDTEGNLLDARRRFYYYSDDGTINAMFAGPLLQLLWKDGIGAPKEWYWRERVAFGGIHPGKKYPPELDCRSVALPLLPKTPPVVHSVPVGTLQSLMLSSNYLNPSLVGH